MVSTPNAPVGLFEAIEKEPNETCLYKRILLDYTYAHQKRNGKSKGLPNL
jgi:hypothetical protein